MGTVFKKTATKPLPAGAKIIVRKGQRLAEWVDAKEKRRTAPVTTGRDGTDRIVITTRTYTAKYRDGSGIVQEVATGCRDESAARSILAKMERRSELVKGEVLTAAEDAVIDHQSTPLDEHIAAFIDHQRAKGLSRRVNDTRSQLYRIAADCGFRRLSDLDATALERWLLDRKAEGMSAATRNEYRGAWLTFCNWCMVTKPARLLSNPFASVSKADANADRRRTRRSLTEAELTRLLDMAHRRPLVDAMTIRRGKRKGEVVAQLSERTRRRLERLGLERALIYKTLVLTGLRKGELASLTVGQLALDADPPYLILEAADEKNRQGSTLPLRADLAADLRVWLARKAMSLQEAARETQTVRFDPRHQKRQKRTTSDPKGPEGESCLPLSAVPTLPADMPLFTVPAGLVRILDRDLRLAGIPKVDERGRTIDVHALRHTFGTLLSKGGVTPRTAQAAMRHSTINLTMNVYTDPKLLDVAGAMEALPALPLSVQGGQDGITVADLRATGTENATAEKVDTRTLPSVVTPRPETDSIASQFAPGFAPTTGKTSILESILDNMTVETGKNKKSDPVAVSAYPVKRKEPLPIADNDSSEWAMGDLNLRHPRCKRGALAN